MDQIQYERGDGPCLTAYREMCVITVPSMDAETRWPEVSTFATQRVVRSSLSAPLIVGDRGIGALNFYSCSENAFTTDDEGRRPSGSMPPWSSPTPRPTGAPTS